MFNQSLTQINTGARSNPHGNPQGNRQPGQAAPPQQPVFTTVPPIQRGAMREASRKIINLIDVTDTLKKRLSDLSKSPKAAQLLAHDLLTRTETTPIEASKADLIVSPDQRVKIQGAMDSIRDIALANYGESLKLFSQIKVIAMLRVAHRDWFGQVVRDISPHYRAVLGREIQDKMFVVMRIQQRSMLYVMCQHISSIPRPVLVAILELYRVNNENIIVRTPSAANDFLMAPNTINLSVDDVLTNTMRVAGWFRNMPTTNVNTEAPYFINYIKVMNAFENNTSDDDLTCFCGVLQLIAEYASVYDQDFKIYEKHAPLNIRNNREFNSLIEHMSELRAANSSPIGIESLVGQYAAASQELKDQIKETANSTVASLPIQSLIRLELSPNFPDSLTFFGQLVAVHQLLLSTDGEPMRASMLQSTFAPTEGYDTVRDWMANVFIETLGYTNAGNMYSALAGPYDREPGTRKTIKRTQPFMNKNIYAQSTIFGCTFKKNGRHVQSAGNQTAWIEGLRWSSQLTVDHLNLTKLSPTNLNTPVKRAFYGAQTTTAAPCRLSILRAGEVEHLWNKALSIAYSKFAKLYFNVVGGTAVIPRPLPQPVISTFVQRFASALCKFNVQFQQHAKVIFGVSASQRCQIQNSIERFKQFIRTFVAIKSQTF